MHRLPAILFLLFFLIFCAAALLATPRDPYLKENDPYER